MGILLGWVQFTNQQFLKTRAEGFDQLSEMSIDALEEQDIKDLSTSLGSSSAPTRINFKISKTKRLIGLIHWVQYHERVSLTPGVIVGTPQDEMGGYHTAHLLIR